MRGVKEISPEVCCPELDIVPSPVSLEEHSARSLEEIENCQTTKYSPFFPFSGFFFHFLSSSVKGFFMIRADKRHQTNFRSLCKSPWEQEP